MNDYFLFFGLLTILFLIVAEFVGRSKHIGRWWSFALLLSGFIPGIIAIISSPSAKKNPTIGGKSYEIWAWILIAFGIINFIITIISMQKGEQPNPVSIIFFISFSSFFYSI